jgi:hypothetical protein
MMQSATLHFINIPRIGFVYFWSRTTSPATQTTPAPSSKIAGPEQFPFESLPKELQQTIHDTVAQSTIGGREIGVHVPSNETVYIDSVPLKSNFLNAKQPFQTASPLALVSRKIAQEHQAALWRLAFDDPATEIHFRVFNLNFDIFHAFIRECSVNERKTLSLTTSREKL